MSQLFPPHIFSMGPLATEFKTTLEQTYAGAKFTELPWDPSSTESPTLQAARLLLVFEQAGGMGVQLGGRILCLPPSMSTLAFFLEIVHRGDWGTPDIIVMPDGHSDPRKLDRLPSDAAFTDLRELRSDPSAHSEKRPT